MKPRHKKNNTSYLTARELRDFCNWFQDPDRINRIDRYLKDISIAQFCAIIDYTLRSIKNLDDDLIIDKLPAPKKGTNYQASTLRKVFQRN